MHNYVRTRERKIARTHACTSTPRIWLASAIQTLSILSLLSMPSSSCHIPHTTDRERHMPATVAELEHCRVFARFRHEDAHGSHCREMVRQTGGASDRPWIQGQEALRQPRHLHLASSHLSPWQPLVGERAGKPPVGIGPWLVIAAPVCRPPHDCVCVFVCVCARARDECIMG